MSGSVAFILKGYPRLSETFVAQEIHGLEQRGLNIHIYSLRRSRGGKTHPVHGEIRAPIHYLPEYLHLAPFRLLRAWRAVRRRTGYPAARRLWLQDLRRDRTRGRIRRFGQAIMLAHDLAPEFTRLHAHFLHTPASVARYTAHITGLPWSCSAHAKDIWTTPDWEKAEKLSDVDWLVTCTAAGRDHLTGMARDPSRIALVYHGIDLDRFALPPAVRLAQRESPADPVTILSVGRAVAKKGYDSLLSALAGLPAYLNWRFIHVGDGPLLPTLRRQADRAGLGDRISWCGALTQDEVLDRYRAADLFVLASRIATDGDRDGLPNVLVEAQSQGLACLATRLSGIPELITDEETGLLVPSGDSGALAQALERLILDRELRCALGAAGQNRVRSAFALELGIQQLADRFGLSTVTERCALRSMHR